MAAYDAASTLPTVVAITGASGSILGFRLVHALLQMDQPVHLIVSSRSYPVIHEEMALTLPVSPEQQAVTVLTHLGLDLGRYTPMLTCYANTHLGAPPASGTYLTRGMVVIPCSMTTLGKLASGVSDNLATRAADVTLKERRPLILLPRESPLNRIHLGNMLRLDEAGALILPPVLSFYQTAFQSLDGQIHYTLGKVLDHLGLTGHLLSPRYAS
jgi:4-hydroxy-3-polyprenylbenzoate decarboxylase